MITLAVIKVVARAVSISRCGIEDNFIILFVSIWCLCLYFGGWSMVWHVSYL